MMEKNLSKFSVKLVCAITTFLEAGVEVMAQNLPDFTVSWFVQ